MEKFKKYKKISEQELRPVTIEDIKIPFDDFAADVSISPFDAVNESPKIGDMIARNNKDHEDQWLIAEKFFKENYKEI